MLFKPFAEANTSFAEANTSAVPHDGAAHALHRDYETRSLARLSTAGAHQYAADKTTEVLCVAYAVDDDPVQLWIPGDPVPPEFIEAAANPNWFVSRTGITSKQRSSGTSWRRASAGR